MFRLALITAPLFGLLGAAPILDFSRFDLSIIVWRFFIITSIALIVWGVNILLLWMNDRLKFRGKDWLRYTLSIAICILIFLLVTQLVPMRRPRMTPEFVKNLPKGFPAEGFPRPIRFLMPLIQMMSINLVIIFLQEILVLRDKKRIIEEENSTLRMFNLEARHIQLKQQLHPHFLFNSLSILRSLIKRSPEQAEEYLEKLSGILRSSINSNKQELIPLSEEIELSTNYLHMQQVRFGNALNYHINIPSSMKLYGKVPVYSIQLLVENAIKHNILTTANPLNIFINGNEQNTTITVSNNLQFKTVAEESNGMGLLNLSERYKLQGNEDIIISKTENDFKVTIKVIQCESSNS